MPQVETAPEVTEAPATKTNPKKAAKKPAAKKAPAKKSDPKAPAGKAKSSPSGTHDGGTVGYLAKSKEDVPWSELKVAFYKALKKIESGTSTQIAKASNGKIHDGHARHFGYHGVGSGLTKVQEIDGTRGFTFVLTAKGRNIDPEAELKKQQEAKASKK